MRNAAQRLAADGRYDEALELFEEVDATQLAQLGAAQQAALGPGIQKLRGKVGTVDLHADTDGASVYVDGRSRGTVPLAVALRVTSGHHVIRVAKSGYRTYEIAVDVAPGRRTVVDDLVGPRQVVEGYRLTHAICSNRNRTRGATFGTSKTQRRVGGRSSTCRIDSRRVGLVSAT